MRFIVKTRKVETPVQQSKRAAMAANGMRHVDFVVPIETWNRFMEIHCKKDKPNTVINRLLEREIGP